MGRKSRCGAADIDLFGEQTPQLNLKGKESIKTTCGGLASILMLLTLAAYAFIRFTVLTSRSNPNINKFEVMDFYENIESVDLNEIGFKFAFTVENYMLGEVRDDPHYVKWIIRIYGKEEGTPYEKVIDYHKCTEEDYKQFYPVSKRSSVQLAQILDNPKRGFFCADLPDEMRIWGETSSG